MTPAFAPLGISFDRVQKRFGSLFALRNLSLDVSPGEFVALLGPNGAGKSTLLRLAARLAEPTSGSVRYRSREIENGEAPAIAQRSDPRRLIGFVAHSTMLYDELTASENLSLFAQLYNLDRPGARIAQSLDACGLAPRAASLVRTFSRGMRQRLAIARALLHDPQLLLLDEPAAGLDRQGRLWLNAMLLELKSRGCTIVMSTHARNESLELASRAIVLAGGKLDADSGPGGDPAAVFAALRPEA